jgi:hypothetical protein
MLDEYAVCRVTRAAVEQAEASAWPAVTLGASGGAAAHVAVPADKVNATTPGTGRRWRVTDPMAVQGGCCEMSL